MIENLLGEIKDAEAKAAKIMAEAEAKVAKIHADAQIEIDRVKSKSDDAVAKAMVACNSKLELDGEVKGDKAAGITVGKEKQDKAIKHVVTAFNKRYPK